MYKESDISLIIATYNRVDDLKQTFISLMPISKNLTEIIIVDQSKDNKTKKFIDSIKSKKIKYLYSNTPSLTRARNIGVSRSSKSSKIVIFIDDDVDLPSNYFTSIIEVFNTFPNAQGVGAYIPEENSDNFIISQIKSLFFLGTRGNSTKVHSVYQNNYPKNLPKTIVNSDWLSGVNMAYKKQIFGNIKFDEKLSAYALAEDFDFSYRVNKKYPSSLYITPYSQVIHRAAKSERYDTPKISYMNQINHFYLNYKNFNSTLSEKLIFIWALTGIFILRTLNLLNLKKSSYLKFKYFISSLSYCIKNLKTIKNGKLDFAI